MQSRTWLIHILIVAILGCSENSDKEGSTMSTMSPDQGEIYGEDMLHSDVLIHDMTMQTDSLLDSVPDASNRDSSLPPTPTCPDGPCGGNVVGQWTMEQICQGGYTSQVDVIDDCPLPATESVTIDASGQLTLHPDETYTSTTILDLSFELSVPNECLSISNSCALLNFSFQNNEETSDWVCEQSTPSSPCVCRGTRVEQEIAEGRYALTDEYLDLTPFDTTSDSPNRPAEVKQRFGYCREDNALYLFREPDGRVPTLTLEYAYNGTPGPSELTDAGILPDSMIPVEEMGVQLDSMILEESDAGVEFDSMVDASPPQPSRNMYPSAPFWPTSDVVPNLVFEQSEDDNLTLQDIRIQTLNEVLVIYSGSAWCSVCRNHMAQYQDMLNRLSDRGLAVIAIVQETTGGQQATRQYAETFGLNQGLTYPVVADPAGSFQPFIDQVRLTSPGAFRIAMVIDLDTMTLVSLGTDSPSRVEELIEDYLR